MTYQEVLAAARACSGPFCKACPVCNGVACKNTIPGPGAKGLGVGAMRNYQAWQDIALNMDTIYENGALDLGVELFGQHFDLPVFAGPVGALKMHYGEKYDDLAYNNILVAGAKNAGIAAFTGDGTNPVVFAGALDAIRSNGGAGIPTVKPWDMGTVAEKLEQSLAADPIAIAMDIDAAGLPFLQGLTPPAGSKTVEELKEIVKRCGSKPFILKGIMTVKGALKAAEAGASAILVSNHGGRVLDQCPATADVLEEIVAAVGDRMTVLVDGGIRTGVDVFKALALGAKGVIIARPYVTAVYGGGEEGVKVYTEKLKAELADTMRMCGAHSIAEISRDMVRKLK
ncbi:MAG: alpha-hydroxy-acid oxidizing protein [Oscillospiraceae bacterium]|nr:alpha-hydroxy-acid oxidizing protein [Oscillospiraceae bacterium]